VAPQLTTLPELRGGALPGSQGEARARLYGRYTKLRCKSLFLVVRTLLAHGLYIDAHASNYGCEDNADRTYYLDDEVSRFDLGYLLRWRSFMGLRTVDP
jgi:hypothetical protein